MRSTSGKDRVCAEARSFGRGSLAVGVDAEQGRARRRHSERRGGKRRSGSLFAILFAVLPEQYTSAGRAPPREVGRALLGSARLASAVRAAVSGFFIW
jgi:hypothetical protein